MGSCFSSSSSAAAAAATVSTTCRSPTAKVINADGSLIEYSQHIEVSHVLDLNHRAYFLCNADELFYGHYIQALDDKHLIELGKLYFFLPAKRLKHPLTAAEMAAFAVSANSALAGAALMKKKKRNSGRKRSVQVVPVVTAMESDCYDSINENSVGSWKTEKSTEMKSEEVKWRAFGRKEGVVQRPFRPKLSSIEEVYDYE